MRDALSIFLEASAARGAWEAAIAAWCTAVTGGVSVSSSHTLLLTRILFQAGQWSAAAHITSGTAACVHSQCISARRVAVMEAAAAANAGCWSDACCHLQDTQESADGSKQSSALHGEMAVLSKTFEHHVGPRIPGSQRDQWMLATRHLRRKHVDHRHCHPPTASGPTNWPSVGTKAAVTNNEELLYIRSRPKERSSWTRAIQLLLTMPHPNAASVAIVLGILSRQGRQNEALQTITTFIRLRGIHPTAVTVKAVAEAANTMRSMALCKAVLRTPLLRRQITPQAAVPLVMALQRLGEWRTCLEWWNSLPSDSKSDAIDDGSLNRVERRETAGLRCHLKLSSYVAVCVALSGRWADSLAALRDATPHDPPLAVLFALRALRVTRQWEVAMCVFQCNRDIWEPSPVAFQVSEVMMSQNAESWIPVAALRALRTHHAGHACGTTDGDLT